MRMSTKRKLKILKHHPKTYLAVKVMKKAYKIKKNRKKILENVAEVKEIVDKNPRITLWSSQSAAVFRYLRKTEPEFSISKEASVLIDEAVSKKYPEIWELFEDI